jgi:uncharacterized protein (DUF2249 family)
MTTKVVELDVREDIRNGREPFSKIMSTVATLGGDDQLLLIAPFEPVPLLRVMEQKGFEHAARPLGSGDWEVLFTRGADASAPNRAPNAPAFAGAADNGGITVLEVDARGLEPPQPMVKIIESLASLPPGGSLRARTDRRPLHLYAQLEARGFIGETEEQSDGSFVTLIRRIQSK